MKNLNTLAITRSKNVLTGNLLFGALILLLTAGVLLTTPQDALAYAPTLQTVKISSDPGNDGTDVVGNQISAELIFTNAYGISDRSAPYNMNGISMKQYRLFTPGTTMHRDFITTVTAGQNAKLGHNGRPGQAIHRKVDVAQTDAKSLSNAIGTIANSIDVGAKQIPATQQTTRAIAFDTTPVGEKFAKATAVLTPENTALLANYPNPFNPETWIPYRLAEGAEVAVRIYNVQGVMVRALLLGYQPAGIYYSRSSAVYWDGRNDLGEKVASGLYFYTLTAGEFSATRKMLIAK